MGLRVAAGFFQSHHALPQFVGFAAADAVPFVQPARNANSRSPPGRAEHRATRDRTHRCRRPETSWKGLRCRTSWSSLRVAPVLARRTWFRAEDRKLKRQCRPAACREPAGSSSECPPRSPPDIRTAGNSTRECLRSAGFARLGELLNVRALFHRIENFLRAGLGAHPDLSTARPAQSPHGVCESSSRHETAS